MQNVQQVLAQLNNMTQPNQNPTFSFQLNLEEANLILAALQEIPAKLCNPISEKIKAQAQEQLAIMQTPQAANEEAPAEYPAE